MRDGERELIVWTSFDGDRWTRHHEFNVADTGDAKATLTAMAVDEDLSDLSADGHDGLCNHRPLASLSLLS